MTTLTSEDAVECLSLSGPRNSSEDSFREKSERHMIGQEHYGSLGSQVQGIGSLKVRGFLRLLYDQIISQTTVTMEFKAETEAILSKLTLEEKVGHLRHARLAVTLTKTSDISSCWQELLRDSRHK